MRGVGGERDLRVVVLGRGLDVARRAQLLALGADAVAEPAAGAEAAARVAAEAERALAPEPAGRGLYLLPALVA